MMAPGVQPAFDPLHWIYNTGKGEMALSIRIAVNIVGVPLNDIIVYFVTALSPSCAEATWEWSNDLNETEQKVRPMSDSGNQM